MRMTDFQTCGEEPEIENEDTNGTLVYGAHPEF